MNIDLYMNFIQQLISDGIKVQNLTLMQLSKSIKLYRLVNRQEIYIDEYTKIS